MDGAIDDVDVVGAPDLEVGVDNRGAVVGVAHLAGADVVVTLGDVVGGNQLSRRLGHGLEGGAVGRDHADELVHEVGDGVLVRSRLQVGRGGDGRGTVRGYLQHTGRGDAVRQVRLDADGVVGWRADGALDVVGAAVVGGRGRPEVDTLAGLGEQTRGLVVEGIDPGLVGVGEGRGGQGIEGILGGQGDSEDGVVHQVLADRQVDPLRLVGESDRHAAALDGLDLGRGADARVDEHAGAGEGTTGQDDLAVGVEVDELAVAAGQLDLDTGGGGVAADDADELGVQGQLEVGLGLGQGEVVTDGTATETILDQPGRVGVDGILVVGRVQGVGLGESIVAEEAGHDGEGLLVVAGAVGEDVTGGALVEGLGRGRDVGPLPARGPLVVKVVLGRLDEHHGVDHGATTQQAAGHTADIRAVLGGVSGGGQVVAHAGHVVLGNGVVVGHGVVAAGGVSGGTATLEEQNGGTRLDETLSNNQTSGTSTGDDVVVGGVARGRGGGRVVGGAGGGGVGPGRGARDVANVLGASHGRPRGVIGRLGVGQAVGILTESSGVVVEGGARAGGAGQGGGGLGVAKDLLGGGGREGVGGADAALAEEGERPAGGVDLGALGNLVDAHGGVVDLGRVAVAGGLAERGHDAVAVGPGADEQGARHLARHGHGGVAVDRVRGNVADEVAADRLGESHTESHTFRLVVREFDAGRRVGPVDGRLGHSAGSHGGRGEKSLAHHFGFFLLFVS